MYKIVSDDWVTLDNIPRRNSILSRYNDNTLTYMELFQVISNLSNEVYETNLYNYHEYAYAVNAFSRVLLETDVDDEITISYD